MTTISNETPQLQYNEMITPSKIIKISNSQNNQYLANNIWNRVSKSPNPIFIDVNKDYQSTMDPPASGPIWNQNITFDSGLKLSSQMSNEKIPELVYIPEYKNKYYYLNLHDIIIITIFSLLFFFTGLTLLRKFEMFGGVVISISLTVLVVCCLIYFTDLNYYYS